MKTVLLSLLTLSSYIAVGQTNTVPLSLGGQLPKIPLGKVMNYKGEVSHTFDNKTELTDFKGKLLIFDFWATWCGSCIEGFPKMAKLQEKYGDKIQIFLVNPRESNDQIQAWINRRRKRDPAFSLIPPNLPVLTEAAEIEKYFPPRGATGYHVWINPSGTFCLRGISENTNVLKIDSLLAGYDVTFVQDNALKYDYSKPFFSLESLEDVAHARFTVSLAGFTDEYADPYGTGVDVFIDTIAGTVRTTLLNQSVHELYDFAARQKFNSDSSVLYGKRVLFDVPDLSMVTRDKDFIQHALTDYDYRKTGHCFEQIVPISFTKSQRDNIMLRNLNDYFAPLLHITGETESRSINCYALVTIFEPTVSKNNNPQSRTGRDKDGHSIIEFQGSKVREIFKQYFMYTDAGFLKNKIIVDDTQFSEHIDLILTPIAKIHTLASLKKELNAKGFDLVKKQKEIEVLVLKSL